jgi:flagellar motility protein MotE (MotC chaperone)
MMNYIRDLRLIPIAVIACVCLLALKAADLLLDGGSLIAGDNAPKTERTAVIRTTADVPRPSSSMLSWASQMFNFPDGSGASTRPVVASLPADRTNNLDITGSVPAETADKDKQAKTEQAKAEPAKPPETKPPGTVIPTEPGQPTGAERAILERLQERRQELDTRARELDIRESLIKAAEKRMEGQLTELKATEARITVATQQKDEAQTARFKGLVTMYENMKPRDAAKIFDRLDTAVLLEVVSKIEPRKMADILALMSPDAAQHLTVELASQAQQVKQSGDSNALPKIQGQPTGQ